jgi:aryl carrier-like protein
VIFTSGSTGEPKGVAMTHRAVVNTIDDVNRRFQLDPDDLVFGLSDCSFDLSVWDIFGTLAAGATLVLPPPEAAREPEQWLELCTRHRVSVWNSVPQLLSAVARQAADASRFPQTLRLALLSGDWIPLDLPERIHALNPRTKLVSLGGATEAAIWSIVHPIDTVDPGWKSVPYGKPLDNQRCYVVDRDGMDCPDWVPGELCIGGAGLADGYWSDALATAERFVRHPETAERLYRTGDLARFHPAGHIELLGRLDNQVKIHGFRVELEEVEAALGTHSAVTGAAAVATRETGGNRRLIAYVTTRRDVAARELLDHVAKALPAYIVPSVVRILGELPLTPNGKVDRKALAARPGKSDGPSRDPGAGPADGDLSDAERRLARVWQDVLEVGEVAPESDFFALGGDSILAMQVVSRARQLGLYLKTRDIFEASSLKALAARAALHDDPRPDDGSGEVNLLPGQIWFLEQDLLCNDDWTCEPGRCFRRPSSTWKKSASLRIAPSRPRHPPAQSVRSSFWSVITW